MKRRQQPRLVAPALGKPAGLNGQLTNELGDNPDFMLMMLDMPITLHRAYVPLTGKVTAALLLSRAVDIGLDAESQAGIADAQGWFARTQQQWTDDIGLSPDELVTARARLRELGVLEERLVRVDNGFHSHLEYRPNFPRLNELLLEQAAKLRRPQAALTSH